MLVLAVAAIVLWQGEETPAQRLERLKTVPAADLARAYLANDHTLSMIAMARQGATVHLDGGTVVTAANADSVAAEYQRRKDTYISVIKDRGSRTLSGSYLLRFKKPCDEESFFSVKPRQEAFFVTLPLVDDLAEIAVEAILVEDVLMFPSEDPASPTTGRVGGDRIELITPGARCAMMLEHGEVEARPSGRLDSSLSVEGAWQGKWDEQFGVRFRISKRQDGFQVVYEWQEYAGGAFTVDTFVAYPAGARELRSVYRTFELWFERGANEATAVGRFGRRTRRAKLSRVGS